MKTVGNKTSKKIDLGAASTFGKDIGINSPTHRNTHDEEVFSPVQQSGNDLLEDLFQSNDMVTPTQKSFVRLDDSEDFNPRADDADFGDFNSAFGGSDAAPIHNVVAGNLKVPPRPPSLSGDEFADFGNAFTVGVDPQPTSSSLHQSNSLLFGTTPIIQPSLTAASASLDLFGGNLAALVNPPPTSSASADLLSDFGGLNLNTTIDNGKLRFLLLYSTFGIFFNSLHGWFIESVLKFFS